ncbi:MAG: hypothetical protein SFU25_03550 [Candidatus Caenarcaniphilales bacterium]|nr:hypothetical protein [Candidatus Caenarcaniphilales bacterium]
MNCNLMKNTKNHSKKNLRKPFQFGFLAYLSLLSLSFSLNPQTQQKVQADPYSSAYGPQAVMSPATTSSLNIGNSAPNASTSTYNPGNGVYLTGQSALSPTVNPTLAPSMAMGPGMPSSYPSGMAASPYYAQPQSMPSMGMMPNSMPQGYQSPYASQMPSAAPGYSPSPYANANTYEAYKPTYGNPAQMVQRNSSSYMAEDLPYRNKPQVVLNPNSMTGMQQGSKPSDAISGILNGPRQTQSKGIPGTNWLGKVFRKDATVAAQPAQPMAPIQNTPSMSKPSRW